MAWVVRSQECSQLDFVRWKQRMVDSRGSATGWTCGRPLHVLGDLNRRRVLDSAIHCCTTADHGLLRNMRQQMMGSQAQT